MGVARRITVLGNGGSGKTTLALALRDALGIPVFHMDRIQWRAGWVRAPEDEVRAELQAILAQDEWIFDGLGALWTIELRLTVADLIVFLDPPLDVCIARALNRQAEFPNGQRPDVTDGCSMTGTDERLVELLRRVDREMIPRIRDWAGSEKHSDRFVTVSDTLETEQLVAIVRERTRRE